MPVAPAPELIKAAAGARYALPAMNVVNMETVQAVLSAAESCGSPVMLQVSPGAIAYAGYDQIRSLCQWAAERAAVPVVVHLDHCRDPEVVRRALRDGFGSVMFDGSRLPYEQNVRLTRELVREAQPQGIAVEAELGYIGGSEDSSLADARAAMISPEQAADFVAATEVDVLAPAIGSLHRMPDESVDLDVEAIRLIARACGRPLALHGGSGVQRDKLAQAIAAGVAKVNISSQLSRAMAGGIREAWQASPQELDLRKFLGRGRAEVQHVAVGYMQLCGSAGRVQPLSAEHDPAQPFEPE